MLTQDYARNQTHLLPATCARAKAWTKEMFFIITDKVAATASSPEVADDKGAAAGLPGVADGSIRMQTSVSEDRCTRNPTPEPGARDTETLTETLTETRSRLREVLGTSLRKLCEETKDKLDEMLERDRGVQQRSQTPSLSVNACLS